MHISIVASHSRVLISLRLSTVGSFPFYIQLIRRLVRYFRSVCILEVTGSTLGTGTDVRAHHGQRKTSSGKVKGNHHTDYMSLKDQNVSYKMTDSLAVVSVDKPDLH